MRWLFLLVLLLSGCATVPPQYSNYDTTAARLQDVIKNNPQMSKADKNTVKDAIVAVRSAKQQSVKNAELEKKVISESKRAGAGTLVYVILGVLALGIVAFIIAKIVRRLP